LTVANRSITNMKVSSSLVPTRLSDNDEHIVKVE